jgi:hypothetical protein
MAAEIPPAMATPLIGRFGKAIVDQVAWYAVDTDAREKLKELFGLEHAEWITDVAMGRAVHRKREYRSVAALLEFNYDLGIELEIVTFGSESPYWQKRFRKNPSFLSHIGIHVEEFPEDFEFPIIYEMWTEAHTNPYLIERKRFYHYRIYGTLRVLGVYLKMIKRVELI